MRNLHRGQQNPQCPARPGMGEKLIPTVRGMGQTHPQGGSWIFPLCSNAVNLPRAVPQPHWPKLCLGSSELPPPARMHA